MSVSFRQAVLITTLGDIAARGLSVIALILLIRALPPAEYADYVVFFAIVDFIASAFASGSRVVYIREASESIGRGIAPVFPLRYSMAISASFQAVGGLGLVLGWIVIASDHTKLWEVGLAIVASLFLAASEAALAYHQARRRWQIAAGVSILRGFILLTATITALHYGERTRDLLVILTIGYGFAAAATVLTSAKGLRVWQRSPVTPYLVNAAQLSTYYVFAAAFFWVDVAVVRTMLSSEDVANMGVAIRYLTLFMGLLPALSAVLRVHLSQPNVVDSPLRQRQLIDRWLKVAMPRLAIAGALGLMATAALFDPINGTAYHGARAALLVLLASAVLTYGAAPSFSLLVAQRRYTHISALYAGAVGFNLAGDVLVVRAGGGVLAIAVISATVSCLLSVAFVAMSRHGSALSVKMTPSPEA